jgi:hypothetical protein
VIATQHLFLLLCREIEEILQHLKVATKNAETKHAIFGLQSGPDHKHWLCFVYDETSDLKDCCSGWASLKEIWPDPKAFCPLVWQRRRRNNGSEPRARRGVTATARSEGNYGGNSSSYMIQVGSGKYESWVLIVVKRIHPTGSNISSESENY